MKTDIIIEKAIDKLHTGWTQGTLAETAEGENCDENDPKAVAWCVTGALRAAMDDLSLDHWEGEGKRLFGGACYRIAFAAGCADDDDELPIFSVIERWNDDGRRTTEDVINACKQALYDGHRESFPAILGEGGIR